jgi:hypothetical protein
MEERKIKGEEKRWMNGKKRECQTKEGTEERIKDKG